MYGKSLTHFTGKTRSSPRGTSFDPASSSSSLVLVLAAAQSWTTVEEEDEGDAV